GTRQTKISWAEATNGKERLCCDRTYLQQATFQSQFFDFPAYRRGNARRHGCRATTSDLTCCDAARRDQQELPGEHRRAISLIEVTYQPATGSPPHLHANGVMAFVVSGTIVSKVGDGAEQPFH